MWKRLAIISCVFGCGGGVATHDQSDSEARTDVSFSTTDSKRLTGYLSTGTSPAGSPGVLLIHQFQQDDEQWGQLPEELAGQGYRVLAFNLRGHGDSEEHGGSLRELLADPALAPLDVKAALRYLKGPGQANPDRLAVIGTSVGANLSVVSSIQGEVKTYVSLSARQSAVEKLAAAPATGMRSVFYFAATGDSGGQQAQDAQTMYELTTEPRRIQIYADSADHGIAILRNQEDATAKVMAWLSETL